MTYHRPISKRGDTVSSHNSHVHVSYIGDPHTSVGCSLGSDVQQPGALQATTVYLPFADFSALLTYKLLRQIDMMEADTVVEASAQNVTCFFWPSEKMYQQNG